MKKSENSFPEHIYIYSSQPIYHIPKLLTVYKILFSTQIVSFSSFLTICCFKNTDLLF